MRVLSTRDIKAWDSFPISSWLFRIHNHSLHTHLPKLVTLSKLLKMPTLINKKVGETGFGLMGFTWRTYQTPDEQSFPAMKVNYLFLT